MQKGKASLSMTCSGISPLIFLALIRTAVNWTPPDGSSAEKEQHVAFKQKVGRAPELTWTSGRQ
jgi:hypothetical protein